ncbi:MAG: hypothetical protein ACQERR_03815 [Pseudomonadota bacterium]
MTDSNNPDAAIRRILEAEQHAEQTVAECEQWAANHEAEAREKARRIAERTETRIQRLRTERDGVSAGEESTSESAVPAYDRTALEAAAEALADELLGDASP